MGFPVVILSFAAQLTFNFINCKRIDLTTGHGLVLLNEHDINVADRNSIIFNVQTCAENLFLVLSNTANVRSNPKASYYTVVFSDTINMISVNCFQCTPVTSYPLKTVGTCDTRHELWVAWDPDGPIKVGQGHVLHENIFMNLEDGNVTDIYYASITGLKPANWSFTVEDDALEFLTPSPDGSTVIELSEDTSPETTIVNITSNRPDLNITAEVYGNVSLQYFHMDGLVLKTRQSLDFEAYQLHNIRLITSESISLSVKVIVTDINDETPNVRCDETVELPEECPVGIGITFPCVITDADHGDVYNITIEGPDNDYFHVDNGTEIRMARRLDRDGEEGRQALNISLVVQDRVGHTVSHVMTVDVMDINDNYPIFSSSIYIINVTENNTVDLPVLNLTVSDQDHGSNSDITVAIHNRDANDCRFRTDNLTLVLEAGNCDFEEFEMREQTYSLTLKAQDNPTFGQTKTAVTVVVIQVQARNEHIPSWNTSNDQQTYTVETQVRNIYKNEQIKRDSIQTHENSSGDADTRGMSSKNTTSNSHTEVDKATNNTEYRELNSNERSHETKGRVEHSGDADNATGGSSSISYMFPIQKVSETAHIGTVVYTLQAFDEDSSEHSQLSYRIIQSLSDKAENASGTFDINPKSGDIMTSLPLDRDDPSNGSAYYTLVVTCSDGEFTINGTLIIEVTEENEYPPVFARSVQSVDFPTWLNEPQMVTNFNVTDIDLHSDISLHFLKETPGFYLQSLNLTWELYFDKPYDLSSSFNLPKNLVVIATDNGTPELTSSAIVIFNQAICVIATTVTSPSATTTSSPRVTSRVTTTQSSRHTTKSCVNPTKQPEENGRSQEEREVLILTIMAATEGIIVIVLLIVTGLVFTGRLFGNENNKEGISDPSLLEDCNEALPLQDLVEKDADQMLDDPGKMVEETQVSKEGEKNQVLKTSEDSGRGSLPSIDESDVKDGLEVGGR